MKKRTLFTAFGFGLAALQAQAAQPRPKIWETGASAATTVFSGQAPFVLSARGLFGMHDDAAYSACQNIVVPRHDPKNPAYVEAGDRRARCMREIQTRTELRNQGLIPDGRVERARLVWNFGEDNGRKPVPYSTLSYPTDQLEGFNAIHVYDRPGTYRLSLEITQSNGEKGVAYATVTVTENKRTTLYVSTRGNDANSGSTTASPLRTLGAALSIAKAKPTRILLRQGDTFEIASQQTVVGTELVIGSYSDPANPSAARPLLKWVRGRAPDGNAILRTSTQKNSANQRVRNQLVIENLAFDTDIAGIFGTNTYYEKTGVPFAIRIAGSQVAVRNCEFRNVNYAVNLEDDPDGVLIEGNSAPLESGIRGYFSWVNGTDHVFLGNFVKNATREHVIRGSGGFERIVAAYNDFTNLRRTPPTIGYNCAVSTGYDPTKFDACDMAKGVFTLQNGFFVQLRGNRVIDGWIIIGPLGQGDGHRGDFTFWAIVDGNDIRPLLNNSQSSVVIASGSESVNVKNNLIVATLGLQVEGYNSAYARGTKKILIAQNSFVSLNTGSRFATIYNSSDAEFHGNFSYSGAFAVPSGESVLNLQTSLGDAIKFRRNAWGEPLSYAGKTFSDGSTPVIRSPERNFTVRDWAQQNNTDEFVALRAADFDANWAPRASSALVEFSEPVAGVFTDLRGKLRPTSGRWTAGAIEAPTATDTSPAPLPSPVTSKLFLYRAVGDTKVAELSNGSTINYASIGTNKIALVVESNRGASVSFAWDTGNPFHIESSKPYASAGDQNGNFTDNWTVAPGTRSLRVKVFSGPGATGALLETRDYKLTFQ